MNNRSQLDIDYHEIVASEYDRVVVEPREYANDLLFAPYNQYFKNKSTMLDIGCGTGHMLIRYAKQYAKVIGIDHSASMINKAKEKCLENNIKHIEFEVNDLYDFLNKSNEKYDLITMVGCLHHLSVDEFEKTLLLLKKHLNNDGLFLIAEPIETSFSPPNELISWNSSSIGAKRQYTKYAQDPDEAPINLDILLEKFMKTGFIKVAESRGVETFSHNYPPTHSDKKAIQELQNKYGKYGHVYSALFSI